MYDVAVIGAGIAGMATAARLHAAGLSTLVLEAHGLPGGCAGYFRRKGFAFDVGATTLVDFAPGGVGDELLDAIGMASLPGERLPGYVAWLPDRTVTLHRDQALWAHERLRMLGDSPAHRRLWKLFDRLADVFWGASRRGVTLPLRSPADVLRAGRILAIRDLPLVRYLGWTVGDALRHYGLREDKALAGLLAMLVEDTVHSRIDDAPLINGVLGATIRGAGLTRACGGMYGFWRRFTAHYRALGGHLRVGTTVTAFRGRAGDFVIETQRGDFHARRVVCALPAPLTASIGPPQVGEALDPYLRRDAKAQGGAVVVFLGVPEAEVAEQPFTHHQILHDYDSPLGVGNNMFISVSAPGDLESAPAGFRSVMLSTHCELSPWQNLEAYAYEARKQDIGQRLLGLARRVYPTLGVQKALVHEVATPRTYERFTRRPRGAVGGARLSLANSNQRAIPHDIGFPGFWMVGDSTWPGLGTVACVLGSRSVAQSLLRGARTSSASILVSRGRADVA
jgi:C-3',4' desaturase CrtD